MKRFGVMALAALSLVACQEKNTYVISGTVDVAGENDSVNLQIVEGRKHIDLQKVAVVDGKFEIKGVADSVQVVALSLGNAFCQFFLEPGEIKVDLKTDQRTLALGTPNNNAYEAYSNDLTVVQEEYAAIAEKGRNPELSETEKEDIKKQLEELEEKFYQVTKNSISENVGTFFGLNNLCNSYYYYSPEELAPVLDSYLAAFPTNARLQRIKANNDLSLETSVGKKFKDFEMADVDGNMRKLSEFIAANEVTLVDFWASWCGPCRAEMPAVKAAYEAYKDKGFGIVGVSLDNNKEAWVGAIANLGMAWPQLSDLQGWGCAGAKLYGVNSIPATVLVAKDGTILAKNLRGEAIQEKLAELLK